MKKIKIDSFRKIDELLRVLDDCNSDLMKSDEYMELQKVAQAKDAALEEGQYEEAAELRVMELDLLRSFIGFMNESGVLEDDVLTFKIDVN